MAGLVCSGKLLLVAIGLCSGLDVSEWNRRAEDALDRVLKVKPNINVAKNVILFLGDGMGITTVTTSRIYKGQKNGEIGEFGSLSFETLPHVALSKTFSNDHQVTESAGSAVALLSGTKVNFGTVGLNTKAQRGNCSSLKGNDIQGFLDWAAEAGKSTGVVTTTRITHATPAAAYAHSVDRNWECDADVPADARNMCKDTAAQLVDDNPNINVIMGGGRAKLLPNTLRDPEYPKNGSRLDNRNLIQEWKEKKQGTSHAYVWKKEDFDKVDPENTDYLLGLFEPSHMQYSLNRASDGAGEPSLAEMVEKAIRILKRNDKGYFLFVEGGRIDHAHHANRPKLAMEDTIAFDEAVTKAKKMTSEKDTLLIVTADHAHPFTMGSWASLNTSILGFVDDIGYKVEPAKDHLPYLSLSYANGPGQLHRNLSDEKTDDKDFRFPTIVPMNDDTHGGQDVAVYARGPMSHLVNGVQEHNYFAYVMAYAACVGPRKDNCSRHYIEEMAKIMGTSASRQMNTTNKLYAVLLLVCMLAHIQM